MILELPKQQKPTVIKKVNWKDTFKRDLYKKNLQIIRKSKQSKKSNKQAQQIACNNFTKLLTDKDSIEVFDQQQPKSGHSYYSTYIPLRKASRFDDEYICTFPYFTYLTEKGMDFQRQTHYTEISHFMKEMKQKGRAQEGWRQCLKIHLCPIDTLLAIEAYIQLLKKGTTVLKELHFRYGGSCKQSIFFEKVCHAARFFQENQQVNRSINISVDAYEQINEASIAKTMKQMFCPICLIYDCTQHKFHAKSYQLNSNERNFQYVSFKNMISKYEHIGKALHLLQFYKRVKEGETVNQKILCSAGCYKNLCSSRLDKIVRFFSPMVKGLIKIGIQLFSYNPCLIWHLISNPNDKEAHKISCEQVFIYFIEEYNILKRISRKLYNTEYQAIINEKIINISQEGFNKKSKRKKNKKSKDQPKITHTDLTVCYHHFIGQESFDLSCQNCSCNQRGFCIPQCLCRNNCPLMKEGCLCRDQKNECRSDKCQCYKQKRQCQPDICHSCFTSAECNKRNNCQNDKILKDEHKLIRVGQSSIIGGGLGAFAGQNIKKNDLVTIYTGQIIQPQIDQIRQSLSVDLSFYNFGSPQGTIDARFMGNKSRFINHKDSGLQNLRADIILTEGKNRIAFYAERDIKKGEELFFDYDGEGQLFKNHKHKYPFITKKK